ncbi:MAG: flagellar basal body rod C-terminal domain-containing protein, partial [Methylococcales bacterium]
AGQLTLAGSVSDLTHKDVLINGQNITTQISGGQLSGALRFRDEVLDPAQQQFGLLAAGFAVAFNDLHKTGVDLNGDPGLDMFALGTPNLTVPVIPNPKNSGIATAVYDPSTIDQLGASDYALTYDGTDFSLTKLSDKSVSTFPGPPPATIAGPGFIVDTDGVVAAGDSFLIRPTFYAAKNIKATLTDPKQVAAAATGSPGVPIPGDNKVAVDLAELEKKTVLLGGKSTFSDVYSQLVAKVGTLTHSANTNSAAHKVLLNQATQTKENLAGVNLDEEAANLIRFQNLYQASSKAIAIANTLFDSLISAVR